MNSLADFITENLDDILADWDAFAQVAAGSANMSVSELRDAAEEMLRYIASDMRTQQSAAEQRRKSEGKAPRREQQSSAEGHGLQRFKHGFDMNTMVSEYRALRATVIRRWAEKNTTPMEAAMQELVRFNEGMDQAVTESIAQFTSEVDQARDLFLATLGHDLRTPLSAIVMTAETLANDPASSEKLKTQAARIVRSARTLGHIADDLLDFTRTRMGGRLPLSCSFVDFAAITESVVDELRPTYPGSAIECSVEGDTVMRADAVRIGQVVTNLVSNALEHGETSRPVQIAVSGTEDEVNLTVNNAGKAIPASELPGLFQPWYRGSDTGTTRNRGLGLYIVREIVKAHGGTIAVNSSDDTGTTFTASFRRHGPA
jgi:signal transduction histidine kinase